MEVKSDALMSSLPRIIVSTSSDTICEFEVVMDDTIFRPGQAIDL